MRHFPCEYDRAIPLLSLYVTEILAYVLKDVLLGYPLLVFQKKIEK